MTKTQDARVFEIDEANKVDENTWRIVGLTLKTINVSDTVCVFNDQNDSLSESVEYAVSRIHVFGRDLPQIDRGFYVELFVAADEGDEITDAKYVYFK